MLKRKGLDDTRCEQLPPRDILDETDPLPRHPLTDKLDYGLMEDLPSGRDSFFCDHEQASRQTQKLDEKCPGFASQYSETEYEASELGMAHSGRSEVYSQAFEPSQAVNPKPLVDFGASESGSSKCEQQPRCTSGQPYKSDSRSARMERDQSCDDCAARALRPKECSEKLGSDMALAPQRSLEGSPRKSNDDSLAEPTIGPEEFSSSEKTEKRSSSWSHLRDRKFVSNSGRVLSHILAVSRDFVKTKRRTIVPAISAVLVLLAFLYLAQPKPYSVETRLMFISGDGRTPDLQGWSLDNETRYFKNTNVVYTLAQKLFESQIGPSASGKPQGQDNSAPPYRPRRGLNDGRDRFKNQGEFIKWFVMASSLETDSSSVPARITLKLTGKDPKFLKAISENYVRSYVEFRRTVPTPAANQVNARSSADNAPVPPVLKTINERLQAFDIQEREYELALNLIDSGKSHFAGFIPKESMVEATSLAHFQQKIVQLELNKNALSLKYAPESREIRTVEAEIQAARKAMRQCLVEQLRFVKHNRELLLTQKMELEKGLSPAEVKPDTPQPVQNEPVRQAVSADAPVSLGNGLYLIWDKPSLTEKPLISKVGDATGSLVAGVQQSIDSVRDAKDSLITGLYNTLVSDDARGIDTQEGEQYVKPTGRYIVRQ